MLPVDNQDRQRLIDDPVNKIVLIHNYLPQFGRIHTNRPKITHILIHIWLFFSRDPVIFNLVITL